MTDIPNLLKTLTEQLKTQRAVKAFCDKHGDQVGAKRAERRIKELEKGIKRLEK